MDKVAEGHEKDRELIFTESIWLALPGVAAVDEVRKLTCATILTAPTFVFPETPSTYEFLRELDMRISPSGRSEAVG